MTWHGKTIFDGLQVNSPWLAWRAWNRSATSMQPGDVVCFWNKTSGDAVATTGKLWVRLRSSGDVCPGGNTFSVSPSYKVAGVVYGASAAQSSAVIVVWAGRVTNLLTQGTVVLANDFTLSDEQGVAADTVLVTGGSGKFFASPLQTAATSSNTNRNAFLTPWRF